MLVTITVPPNSPIDAPLPEEEARAASLIDSARVRGGRRVTGHWEKVRPGGAGRRIVEEAREIRARALVMALPPRRAGASLFGKTLETVLERAPLPGDHRVVARGERQPRRRRLKPREPSRPVGCHYSPVQRAYLASTRLLSAALLLVGVAMVASTIARGGGALAVGVLLGTMLALIGAARLWLARGGEQ